ncbi:MAG: hypothetical protein QXP70_03090 [Methanomassiliicoccales archaeon]
MKYSWVLVRKGDQQMADDILSRLKKESYNLVDTEALFVQAVQDIIRGEIKRRLQERIDKEPALKNEIKAAVSELIEARVKQAAAMMRLAKIAARIGLELLPDDLKEEVTKEFTSVLEREISELFQRIS